MTGNSTTTSGSISRGEVEDLMRRLQAFIKGGSTTEFESLQSRLIFLDEVLVPVIDLLGSGVRWPDAPDDGISESKLGQGGPP